MKVAKLLTYFLTLEALLPIYNAYVVFSTTQDIKEAGKVAIIGTVIIIVVLKCFNIFVEKLYATKRSVKRRAFVLSVGCMLFFLVWFIERCVAERHTYPFNQISWVFLVIGMLISAVAGVVYYIANKDIEEE